MHIELRTSAQTLSDHLSIFFDCEMRSESAQEHVASFHLEEVRAAVSMLDVVGRSSLQSLRHRLSLRSECIAEVRVEDASITIFVVPANKKVDIVLVWVSTELP